MMSAQYGEDTQLHNQQWATTPQQHTPAYTQHGYMPSYGFQNAPGFTQNFPENFQLITQNFVGGFGQSFPSQPNQRPITPPGGFAHSFTNQRLITPPGGFAQSFPNQRMLTPHVYASIGGFEQNYMNQNVTGGFTQSFPNQRAITPPDYMQQQLRRSDKSYMQQPRSQTPPPYETGVRPSIGAGSSRGPPPPLRKTVSRALHPEPSAIASTSSSTQQVHSTLTEPVSVTISRDVKRVVNNLKQIVVFNSAGTDHSRTLRDWDLWGPFFFIIALSCILSSTASDNKSTVFAIVFAVLSSGAVSLTMNVVLLGGKLNFLQSLSVLGYCLFPLDIGAILCAAKRDKIYRLFIVTATLLWSSWSVYPFVSSAVRPSRKALAVYPVFLMYISMGFLVLAND